MLIAQEYRKRAPAIEGGAYSGHYWPSILELQNSVLVLIRAVVHRRVESWLGSTQSGLRSTQIHCRIADIQDLLVRQVNIHVDRRPIYRRGIECCVAGAGSSFGCLGRQPKRQTRQRGSSKDNDRPDFSPVRYVNPAGRFRGLQTSYYFFR